MKLGEKKKKKKKKVRRVHVCKLERCHHRPTCTTFATPGLFCLPCPAPSCPVPIYLPTYLPSAYIRSLLIPCCLPVCRVVLTKACMWCTVYCVLCTVLRTFCHSVRDSHHSVFAHTKVSNGDGGQLALPPPPYRQSCALCPLPSLLFLFNSSSSSSIHPPRATKTASQPASQPSRTRHTK
ncbi:hypothetical protein IWX91DRAFT_398925 [Phyllosticta citricarpa]